MKLTASSSNAPNIKIIKIKFYQHQWNTAKFDLQNSADPLVCLVSNIRCPCSFTTDTLSINIDTKVVLSNIATLIQIDT